MSVAKWKQIPAFYKNKEVAGEVNWSQMPVMRKFLCQIIMLPIFDIISNLLTAIPSEVRKIDPPEEIWETFLADFKMYFESSMEAEYWQL